MLYVVLGAAVAMFAAGGLVGEHKAETRYQQQAIERGFAEFDATTGEWQWKPSTKNEETNE